MPSPFRLRVAPKLSRQAWRRLALAGLVCAVLVWQGWALFVGEFGMPESRESGDTYWVEVSGDRTVSQGLVVQAARFGSIGLRARSLGAHPGPVVHLELDENWGGGKRRFFAVTLPTAAVSDRGWLEVRLPTVVRTSLWEWSYRLRISVSDAPPGAGLALLANRHDSYRDGALFVDGREQWGDLVFRTGSSRARISENVKALLHNAPAIVRSDLVLGPVLAAHSTALVLFFWGLLGGFGAADRSRSADGANRDRP